MPSSLRQCATPCHHNHIHSPHTHTATLIFYLYAHLKGEGGTGVEERRGEGRIGERGEDNNTVEYSQLMMTVCGCFVQTLQSLQSFFFFFFFCLLHTS